MRGAVRLSALMKLPSIWVYTHDSIGLGEDGPTHQPVEHLAGAAGDPAAQRGASGRRQRDRARLALRAAQHRRARPAFALSRQNLPILDPDAIPDDAIERGAYVLRDSEGGDPELILIGTGSEVSLCLEAADALDGVRVRVVSMPCMDTFTAGRRGLPRAGPAARPAGPGSPSRRPARWAGTAGSAATATFVGMETFGESGPAAEVYEHFGITAAARRRARPRRGATIQETT